MKIYKFKAYSKAKGMWHEPLEPRIPTASALGVCLFFDDQGGRQMRVVRSNVAPCLLADNLQKGHSLICIEAKPKVLAFSQNTREEVRVLGKDGNCAGCLSAEGGMHQSTFVLTRKRKNNILRETLKRGIRISPKRTLCCNSKLDASQIYNDVSCTILATSYKEPPLILRGEFCE